MSLSILTTANLETPEESVNQEVSINSVVATQSASVDRNVHARSSEDDPIIPVATANRIGGVTAETRDNTYTDAVKIDPLTARLYIKKIPTKVSELENDSDYATETEVSAAVGLEAIARANADATKVDKVSNANKIYGTDSAGAQTTYDKDSFGQVDDVKFNGNSVVSNKIAVIPNDLNNYSNTTTNFQNATQVNTTISAHNSDENAHPLLRELVEDEIEARELACGALSDRVDDIEEVIPNQATSSNQLADKAFVNSSIENLAAFYVTKRTGSGTQEDPYQYVPFSTKAELNNTTIVYIGGVAKTPGKNDYAIVLGDESKQGTATQAPTTRYLYPKSNTEPYDPLAWEFQYIVNNTGLTAVQMAAINSGITSSKVEEITANTAARHTHSNKPVLDGIASTNLVSSSDRSNWNGKQNVIDSTHKLNADLVNDSSSINKFVTSQDKINWNNKTSINDNSTTSTTETWSAKAIHDNTPQITFYWGE